MAATDTDELVTRSIVSWRYDELVRAGCDREHALALAENRRVDLHRACDLLRRDCPPHLALRILA